MHNQSGKIVHGGGQQSAVPRVTENHLRELFSAGRWSELESAAGLATAASPGELWGWQALSKALLKLGKWLPALEALLRVTELAPGEADGHHDLGYVLYRLGREEEAEAAYRRALACDARLAQTHCNLGALLADLGRLAEAAVHFQQALAIDPESSFALFCLGSLMERVGGMDEGAISCLQRSLAINPHDPNACTVLGNLLLRNGRGGEAMETFRRGRDFSPLITWRARKERADFSVLLLYAPGAGCTPLSHLLRMAPYDCHFYCVLPYQSQHHDLLREKADVVVNMISDADYDKALLPFARELVDSLGRPAVNHPVLIGESDRQSVARRLAGIPLCRVPRTVRLNGAALAEAARNRGMEGFSLPVLVRAAGKHGGEEFDKFDDWESVASFLSGRPEADYYLTEFVDYRSADGLYRKYRLISVDGRLYPYHLAIHDHWKVHHFRTDMANQAWMCEEEEAFLWEPQQVFDGQQLAALQAAMAASGLDYCGIDCGLDQRGEIVLFETNATMLVHDEKDDTFAYKNPYIARIRDAFHAMLARRATGC